MEKKKFSYKQDEEPVKIKFNGETISVQPYIRVAEKIVLIDRYISDYFYPPEDSIKISSLNFDSVGAKHSLILAILDLKTSIDIRDDEFDLDDFLASGLWDEIKESIQNYAELEKDLLDAIENKKYQIEIETSISYVFSEFMKQLSEKIGVENIDKLKILSESLINEMKSDPITSVLSESGKHNQNKKRVKKA